MGTVFREYEYGFGLILPLWYAVYVRTLGTSTMVKTLKIREISIQIRQTSKLRIWRSNPFAPDLATFAPRK